VGGLSGGGIAGIVIAALCVTLLIAGVIAFRIRRSRSNEASAATETVVRSNPAHGLEHFDSAIMVVATPRHIGGASAATGLNTAPATTAHDAVSGHSGVSRDAVIAAARTGSPNSGVAPATTSSHMRRPTPPPILTSDDGHGDEIIPQHADDEIQSPHTSDDGHLSGFEAAAASGDDKNVIARMISSANLRVEAFALRRLVRTQLTLAHCRPCISASAPAMESYRPNRSRHRIVCNLLSRVPVHRIYGSLERLDA
jgi:hypothetical protein